MYLVRKPARRALDRYCGDRRTHHGYGCGHPKRNFDGIRPRLDIFEDSDNLYIAIELPGLEREDVNVSIDKENVLKISGEKKQRDSQENEEQLRSERRYGKFERSFRVKETIDSDKISAEMDTGVLKVVLPKITPRVNEIKID